MTIFPEINHMVWAIINFLILLFLLNKVLYKPLTGMMAAREKTIADNLQRAEQARAEAEQLRQQFAQQVAAAQKEAQETLAAARKAAEGARDEILGQARAEAARMIENAQAAIEREKQAALAELRQEVADLAILAASRVVKRSLDSGDQRRLVAEFVEGVGER